MMRQNCLSVYDRLLHFVRILMASKCLHDHCRHVFSYPHIVVRYLRDPTKHKKEKLNTIPYSKWCIYVR